MVYLNQAATTYPKPECVRAAHAQALCDFPEDQFRSSFSGRGKDIFESCRKNLGKLLGIADYSRIFFSSGATDSANALIYGLPLNEKEVIVTEAEHNSILRPLLNLKNQVGGVIIAPCERWGRINPRTIAALINEKTAAVFVNHCSNVTGIVQNIAEIGKITKRAGVLLITDISQSAGCIPVEADAWGVDALIFTGHKSLFGVQGTGGYYVRKEIEFTPFRYGGTGKDSRVLTYENADYEYEVGTQNAPGIAALNAGARYILDKTVQKISKKERSLMSKLYSELSGMKQVIVYGTAEENAGPVLSFNIKTLKAADTAYILRNGYSIVTRAGLHCSPLMQRVLGTDENGTIRISISDMTKDEDVDALIKAVKEISESVK